MTNLGILDLVIGLFFIYFVLSVICTAVVEGIAQMRDLRGKHLSDWLIRNFTAKLGNEIQKHDLVRSLSRKKGKADYIPAKIFAAVLLDLIHQKSTEGKNDAGSTYNVASLKDALLGNGSLLPEDLKRYLLQAIEEKEQDAAKHLKNIRKRLEDWYDDSMESVTGTYKRATRFIGFIAAIAVTIFSNADTIALSKYLKDNPEVRAQLVASAEQATKDSILLKHLDSIKVQVGNIPEKTLDSLITRWQDEVKFSKAAYISLKDSGLPLGLDNFWPIEKSKMNNGDWVIWWISRVAGLLLTALALTLGAPFWFDMINKVVNIRSVGKKPKS